MVLGTLALADATFGNPAYSLSQLPGAALCAGIHVSSWLYAVVAAEPVTVPLAIQTGRQRWEKRRGRPAIEHGPECAGGDPGSLPGSRQIERYPLVGPKGVIAPIRPTVAFMNVGPTYAHLFAADGALDALSVRRGASSLQGGDRGVARGAAAAAASAVSDRVERHDRDLAVRLFLIVGVRRIDLDHLVPQTLALLARCRARLCGEPLRGDLHGHLRQGVEVPIPGRMLRRAALRCHDHVAAPALAMDQRHHPRLAGVSDRRRQQQGRQESRAADRVGVPHMPFPPP